MKINLSTLKYIVALEAYRNFVKAAEACGVTQPTLSAAIKKMEAELDIVIFDRNSYPVEPTVLGSRIVEIARRTIYDVSLIEDLILDERNEERGKITMGMLPTVAPYILPGLFREIRSNYPGVELRVSEMRTESLMERLRSAQIDMAVMVAPQEHGALLEVPMYYERFVAYVSPEDEFYRLDGIPAESLSSDRMWVLEDGHCMNGEVSGLCQNKESAHAEYRAGSIDTLVRVVDSNGGYTVIPELHVPLLSDSQQGNVRPIVCRHSGEEGGYCCPVRRVSLMIREDFVREKMLNIVVDSIRNVIPDDMSDTGPKRFAIKI